MGKENIIGKNLSEKWMEKASNYIEKSKEEGLKRIDGEYDKDSTEINFIEMVNNVLREELNEMQIEGSKFVAPDQIHSLNDETYQKMFGNSAGTHLFFDDAIYINRDSIFKNANSPSIKHLKVILHEIIHSYAFRKYYVNIDKEIKHTNYSGYRYGYQVEHPYELNHLHFQGFNEAVTEEITSEMEQKYFVGILQKLNFPQDDLKEVALGVDRNPTYEKQREILLTIIKRIANTKQESEQSIWQQIKGGYFTGEMMYLRDIEKVFGKGSLRVLAAMDCGMKDNPPIPKYRQKINNRILEYFETSGEENREEIAHSILNERERMKYINRRKN